MKSGRSTKKEGARRGSKKNQNSGAPENYQSIFSFTENELENVLQMFETPVGVDQGRGYGALQDHYQQGGFPPGAMPNPHPTQGYPAMQGSSHPGHPGPYGPVPTSQPPQQHMWYGMPGQHDMNQANGGTNGMAGAAATQPSKRTGSSPNAAGSQVPPQAKAAGRAVKQEVPHEIPQRFLPKKQGSGVGGVFGNKATSSVSHSVAEKQRRDRINTLIDELRELVPIDLESAEAANQPYGEDPSKRPKHVVLSDTIKFVRNVLIMQRQQQMKMQQAEMSQGGGSVKKEPTNGSDAVSQNSSGGKPHRQSSGNGDSKSSGRPRRREGSAVSDSSNDSDSQADGIEIFVSKLESNNQYSVNVCGKDRNGLLHDITRALKSLDLEIKTATIKTEASGLVSDTFAVDKSYCTLSPKEIESQLGDCLSSEFEVKRKRTLDDGDKRKRSDAL